MEPITFQVEDMAPHLLDCFVVDKDLKNLSANGMKQIETSYASMDAGTAPSEEIQNEFIQFPG